MKSVRLLFFSIFVTLSLTAKAAVTGTVTFTPSQTKTLTPGLTQSPTHSATITFSPTISPTFTTSPTPTWTPTASPVNTATPLPGASWFTRSDIFTTTGTSQHLTATSNAMISYSVTVKSTVIAATAWNVVLEGSLDGVNFSTILTHTETLYSDGETLYSWVFVSPSLYIRTRVVSLTLGPASNIIVTILGTGS